MNKKHGFLAAAAVLFVAAGFALSFMACSDSKPSKPSLLETTATYQQTLDKCDEAINYCNNSTDNNKTQVNTFEMAKTFISTLESDWDSVGPSCIEELNDLIAALE